MQATTITGGVEHQETRPESLVTPVGGHGEACAGVSHEGMAPTAANGSRKGHTMGANMAMGTTTLVSVSNSEGAEADLGLGVSRLRSISDTVGTIPKKM
jgi:hypothetical protein